MEKSTAIGRFARDPVPWDLTSHHDPPARLLAQTHLRRGHDLAVAQQRGGAVVMEGGDPEDERYGIVSTIACAIMRLPRSPKWRLSRKMSWVSGTRSNSPARFVNAAFAGTPRSPRRAAIRW